MLWDFNFNHNSKYSNMLTKLEHKGGNRKETTRLGDTPNNLCLKVC